MGPTTEERDLVAECEVRFRDGRRQVPMLIPWRGRLMAARTIHDSAVPVELTKR